MAKVFKRFSIAVLSVLMAICAICAVFGQVSFVAKADVTPVTLEKIKGANTFKMDGGAEIRLGDYKGLRFTATLSTSDYAGLVAQYGEENLTFGSFMLPSAYVTGTTANPEYAIGTPNIETCFGESAVYTWAGKEETSTAEKTYEILHTVADKTVIAEQGLVNGFVKEMKPENYGVSYIGYSYIKAEVDGVAEYLFATQDVSNARSPILVAANALATGDYEGTAAEEIKEFFGNRAYTYIAPTQNATAYDAIKTTTGCEVVLPNAAGSISKLYIDGKVITDYSYDDATQTITFNDSALENISGEVSLVAVNKDKVYSGTVCFIDGVITDVTGLETMRAATSGYYVLGDDIEMSNQTLSAAKSFSGVFDGRGYTISNLTYTDKTQVLFSTLGGTVKNLVMQNVVISGNGTQLGAIAEFLSSGTIDNVYISVNLSTANYAGGFVKQVSGTSSITNSVVNVTAIGANSSGLMVAFGAGNATLDLTGTYVLKPSSSSLAIVGNRGDTYATFRDTVNATDTQLNPKSFSTVKAFAAEYNAKYATGKMIVNKENCAKIGIDLDANSNVTIVSTADEFAAALAANQRYKDIVLTADIDMKNLTGGNKAVTPISVYSNTFNGNGHSISNLILKYGGGSGTGIFTQFNEGTIKDLALINVTYDASITSASGYTATIAGGARGATIDNVFVSVDISKAGNKSAGLVGWINASAATTNITNCVVVVNNNTADATQGAIVGHSVASGASPLNFSGTHTIVSSDTVTTVGSTCVSTINNDVSGMYTSIGAFRAANIDLSGYGDAIRKGLEVAYSKYHFISTAAEFSKLFADANVAEGAANASTPADWTAYNAEYRNKDIVLLNDIDMAGQPALFGLNVFSAEFDGLGHSISNLKFKHGGGNGTAIFRQLNEGTVKNLALINVTYDASVTADKAYTATIAGAARGATIDNVFVSVNISDKGNKSAGLVGWINASGTTTNITNCVVVVNNNTADATQGAIVGSSASGASSVNFSGTYAIVDSDTVTIVGSGCSSTIANEVSGKYTSVQAFKDANIDFSNYNDAVKNNVPK